MRTTDAVRLRHMLEAAREGLAFAAGRTRADLDTDRQLYLSLIRSIEVVGEAASKVSDECRSGYRAIPWVHVISMRNRLIHMYFDVDPDIVWRTTTVELPRLVSAIETLLAEEG